MKLLRCLVAGGLFSLGAACSGGSSDPPPPQPLALFPVEWNPSHLAVGGVTTVAEIDSTTVLFGDKGATVLVSGGVVASDSAHHGWQGASTVAAPGGSGAWLVGVDGDGRVLELRGGAFEDVSDRFGLAKSPAHDVAALGGTWTAFALDGQIAVADGHTVQRYDDVPGAVFAAGDGRVASVAGGAVRVMTPPSGTAVRYAIDGVKQAAFLRGKLVLITDHELLSENDDGSLDVRFHSAATLGSLTVAGARAWLTVGADLATFEDGVVHLSSGANLALDARLVGSPGGDVWAISRGQLSAFSTEMQTPWRKTVRPIFGRVCAQCHLPGGSAGIDLSTEAAWVAHGAAIRARVVEPSKMPMPPAGVGFSTTDRDAIAAWLALVSL